MIDRTRAIELLVLAIVVASTAVARAAEYPAPEGYLADGRFSAYQDAVLAYLKSNPDSLDAPRAAMDLMQAASVLNDPSTVYRMRKSLLLNYTSSIQGRYVLMQFRDASDYSQMMFAIFAETVESMPPGFPARFDAAMRAGLKRFESMTGPPEFIAFAIAMSHEVSDKEIETNATDILSKSGERAAPALQLAQILVDDKTPLADRVARLHAMTNRAMAIPFERYLINKMTDAEKNLPGVLRAVADDFLFQRRLSDALAAIEKVPDVENDARLSFWRAAAVAAGGDNSRAAKMFSDVAGKFPADPWGKEAATLQPIVAEIDHSIVSQTDDLLKIFSLVSPMVGHTEMTATYEREDHTLTSIYCGIVAGSRFDLSASQGGVVRVGFRSSAVDSAYYFAGDIPNVNSDGLVHKYSTVGVVLSPMPQWDGTNLRINFNGRWMHLPGDLIASLGEMLKLPMFQNRDSMLEWLRQNTRAGRFPVPAGGTDVKTYAWLAPDPIEPKMSRLEYSLDEKNLTLTYSDGGFKVTSLHFSTGDGFDLKPPAWPFAKETNEAKIEQNIAAAVVPAMQALMFGPPPAATQPSTQPGM